MPDLLIHPVGKYLFSNDQLVKALAEVVPQIPADRNWGWGVALDVNGVRAGIIFQRQNAHSHWFAETAFTVDPQGGVGIGAKAGGTF